MRIAQVAPLHERVPPRFYGGTERIVAYLTDELVRQGHDVTLFASADSATTAHLVPWAPGALRLDPASTDPLARHLVQLERVWREGPAFDVIHFHSDYLHFPLTRRAAWTSVTTLHGRLDVPDLQPLYDEFGEMPVVSISDAQRAPLPQARWAATVYHGLPADLYAPSEAPGRYLAFVGRISREKRVDRAIEIARRAGLPLRIAAKIDAHDRAYFEAEIRPLFDLPFVEYVGEIGEAGKNAFLGGASALLFPIDWAEPFGLVMIEAMACGTPVIAWPGGSVAEVVADGATGFIVTSVDAAVEAVGRLPAIDRRACRAAFEARFTVERMARDYLGVYHALRFDHVPDLSPARAPVSRGAHE